MKELKKTVTQEVITGYQTDDGHVFASREEAEKYEKTAEYAITSQFRELMVGDKFAECEIYESFGYGSDEYYYCVIEIQNEKDLNTALMYQKLKSPKESRKFSRDMIGKRILVALGYGDYDEQCTPFHTYEELVDRFAKETKRFFETAAEQQKEKQ